MTRKIAIYGKGGSGKSTISAALSVAMARRGLKVLQVGCDPKADSTLSLTGGRRIPTLLDLLSRGIIRPEPGQFIVAGRMGVDCAEAGGPAPGAGCGGRGIARMFELFNEIRLFEKRPYDVVLFDVLGDVVCGGFAAPLRYGFAERAFIVVSEEPLSLYAANNIIHAIETYRASGVRLGGLIVNEADGKSASSGRVARYASAVGAPVSGTLPRDPAIQEAEATDHLTAAELPADSPTVAAVESICDSVLASFQSDPGIPPALDIDQLFSLFNLPLATAPTERAGQGSTGASLRPGGVSDRGDAGDGARPEPWRSSAIDHRPSGLASDPVSGGMALHPKLGTRGGGSLSGISRRLPEKGTVTGGAGAVAALSSLLALSTGKRKEMEIALTAFAWEAGTFRVALESPFLGKVEVRLRRAPAEDKAYARIGDLAVSYGHELPRGAKPMLDYVVKRLERLGADEERLARLLTDDSESRMGTVGDDARLAAGENPRHWCIWGESLTQGFFLLTEERARQVVGLVRLGGARCLNIHHAHDVCQFSKQKQAPWSSHFVRPPWIMERSEHTYSERSDWVSTLLGEYHLIAGSNDLLQELLDTSAEQGEAWDAVNVYISCSPVIAGEDWEGAVRTYAQRVPVPVMASGVRHKDVTEDVARSVQVYLERWGREEIQPERGKVHVVGFPPTAGTLDLLGLLRMCGVRVMQRQIPAVYLKGLQRYGEARVQVFWPQVEFEALYEEVFRPLGVPVTTALPPFGIQGTMRFLEQVAGEAGIEPDFAGELAGLRGRAEERLGRLRERASGHRLGIALTSGQARLLDRPERMCGIPLVPFLEELGFRVEVLNGSEELPRLDWWLSSGLSAVLTDIEHDERLLHKGVGQFGLADLEPGFDGAVRTAERLLAVCEMAFVRDYARYVGGEGPR